MLNSTDKLLVMWGSSPGCLSTCTPVSKCLLHMPVDFSTCKLIIGPAFVNTLFAVTYPHHIYSSALLIITVNDNLKYIIIFIYICFLPWKIHEASKNRPQCPGK